MKDEEITTQVEDDQLLDDEQLEDVAGGRSNDPETRRSRLRLKRIRARRKLDEQNDEQDISLEGDDAIDPDD